MHVSMFLYRYKVWELIDFECPSKPKVFTSAEV